MNINIILIIAIFVLIHYMYIENEQNKYQKQLEGFNNSSNNIPTQHSKPLSPLTGYEPTYEPETWNDNPNIKKSHNCYSYMLNNQSGCLENLCEIGNCKYINPQPGHYSGITTFVDTKKTTCDKLEMRMMSDNPYIENSDLKTKCKDGFYKTGLAIDPKKQYHFYRQDSNGYWSHKDGGRPATNIDASNQLILDPAQSNRNYTKYNYTDWCGYYCVPNQNTNMSRRKKINNEYVVLYDNNKNICRRDTARQKKS
jgi:hypothetical protein